MRFKQDLMKKLNLNILDLTNQTVTDYYGVADQ